MLLYKFVPKPGYITECVNGEFVYCRMMKHVEDFDLYLRKKIPRGWKSDPLRDPGDYYKKIVVLNYGRDEEGIFKVNFLDDDGSILSLEMEKNLVPLVAERHPIFFTAFAASVFVGFVASDLFLCKILRKSENEAEQITSKFMESFYEKMKKFLL